MPMIFSHNLNLMKHKHRLKLLNLERARPQMFAANVAFSLLIREETDMGITPEPFMQFKMEAGEDREVNQKK